MGEEGKRGPRGDAGSIGPPGPPGETVSQPFPYIVMELKLQSGKSD